MNYHQNNLILLNEKSININGMTLSYFLYRSQKKSNGRYIYSVCITLSTAEETGSNFVFDITRKRSRADEIFNLICEGTVTPCTLTDILEDIL